MQSSLLALESAVKGLNAGSLRGRAIVEGCLSAARDPAGEGARVFTRLYQADARAHGDAFDAQSREGRSAGLLGGVAISIKDLFDVAGEPTSAGSTVLKDEPIAARDAEIVTRLRRAGAILIGRTNMTEFAYSGLGLNPHYGTPRNPWARREGRIPGGSSSGAAVSVADGMALAAIGSDTGGSVRIPAALCGLTGLKPTARRVPLDGVLPLSPSLDSIGSIAPTVACCARLDAVLSGSPYQTPKAGDLSTARLGVLQGYVIDGVDSEVSQSFERALRVLSSFGARLFDTHFASLDEIPNWNSKGGFPAAESYAWHRPLLEKRAAQYDPRVLSRILRGKEISAGEYSDLQIARERLIRDMETHFSECDAWLLPTVPWVAPRIADLEADEARYFEANAMMLRNPSIINFLDACAISIPCQREGDAPVGLMVAAPGGRDASLFNIASAIEQCFRRYNLAVHIR